MNKEPLHQLLMALHGFGGAPDNKTRVGDPIGTSPQRARKCPRFGFSVTASWGSHCGRGGADWAQLWRRLPCGRQLGPCAGTQAGLPGKSTRPCAGKPGRLPAFGDDRSHAFSRAWPDSQTAWGRQFEWTQYGTALRGCQLMILLCLASHIIDARGA